MFKTDNQYITVFLCKVGIEPVFVENDHTACYRLSNKLFTMLKKVFVTPKVTVIYHK